MELQPEEMQCTYRRGEKRTYSDDTGGMVKHKHHKKNKQAHCGDAGAKHKPNKRNKHRNHRKRHPSRRRASSLAREDSLRENGATSAHEDMPQTVVQVEEEEPSSSLPQSAMQVEEEVSSSSVPQSAMQVEEEVSSSSVPQSAMQVEEELATIMQVEGEGITMMAEPSQGSLSIPQLTTDYIMEDALTQTKKDSVKLSSRAFQQLKSGRLIATIPKQDPSRVYFNDRLHYQGWEVPVFRRNNLQELLTIPDQRQALSQCHYKDLMRQCGSKSLWYLSFVENPEMWLDRNVDIAPFQGSCERQGNGIPNYETENTRSVEQDTSSPDIRRVSGAKCVVVGDPNVIARTFDGSLSYGDACNRTIRSIFSLKDGVEVESVGKNVKRSNDFPVLVALDTKKYVNIEGTMYCADFSSKTKEAGSPITPLLLSSCTEVMMRVQAFYILELYKCGKVELDPTPIDMTGVFFKLRDEDEVSQLLNFVRSDTIMFQVCIVCTWCGHSHNDLWHPNDEDGVSETLKSTACTYCGRMKTLQNESCFVLKETNIRRSLDPGSSRLIHYEYHKSKKETVLPPNVNTTADMPKFERVWSTSSVSKLRLDMEEDFGRKNKRTPSIAVTLYIPTVFNREKTLASVRQQIEGFDVELDEGMAPDDAHLIDMFCYHKDREHHMQIVATRVKLSMTCNKEVPVIVKLNESNDMKFTVLRHELSQMKESVKTRLTEDHQSIQMNIGLPSTQTNKRIGVQTINAAGDIITHTSPVLVPQATRKGSKRQEPIRMTEEGKMFSALNFWSHPHWDENENFLRFRSTLVSGLVYNMFSQGSKSIQGQSVHLLPLGQFKWIELDKISGTLNPDVKEKLYNKTALNCRQVKDAISEKDEKIRELEATLASERATFHNTSVELQVKKRQVKELEHELAEVRVERNELKRERDDLERQLRALKRECGKLTDVVQKQGKQLEMVTRDNTSLREGQEELKKQMAQLAETMKLRDYSIQDFDLSAF